MKPRHQISRAAIDLIKRFEGYRQKAARLDDGRWTIGYGHTLSAREGAEVSEADAEALLLYDVIAVAHAVNEHVYAPLNQNQFDALCCFAFNIGVENFRRSSVLRRINEGQFLQAALGMELWRKAEFEGERIVIDALVRRRAAEKALFLTPVEGWTPAPSPVLRPNIDADVAGIVPRETPAVVEAAMEGERAVALRAPEQDARPVPPDEDEDKASPAQAAAAAVSYRLQAIFREPEAPEAEPAPAEEEAPAFALTAPEAAPVEPEPEVQAEVEAEPQPSLFEQPVQPADSPFQGAGNLFAPAETERRPLAFDSLPPIAFEDDFDKPKPAAAERPSMNLLLILAGLGLVLFAGGLFWAFNARETAPALVSPLTVGWAAGVLGVGFFGVAAYMILQRLGSDEDEDRRR